VAEVGGLFGNASFYDGAFDRATLGTSREDVAGIIVNHHLLAPELIVEALSFAATDEPLTVVLIAPDHFNAGAAPITTGYVRFTTPYGDIEPDIQAIGKLVEGDFVLGQDEPFEQEHGIFNITAFIKRLMPNATIVPLIVKDTVPSEALRDVSLAIQDIEGDILVVGSFDFTHHATMREAELNDAHSAAILRKLDYGRIDEIAVDSHAGLSLVMRTMMLLQAHTFTVLNSTNSARVTKQYGQTDVTSYITGLFIN
jgi:AmmeMemoRadiSam system protein B